LSKARFRSFWRTAEFIEIAKRLRADPDSFDWPLEDPLLCVALAFNETTINRLREQRAYDRVGQLRPGRLVEREE
jgi:hypothetical protein